jgi:dTDP-4-dehydrorhamnose reductase
MPANIKVIVTGSNGQLGNELKELAPSLTGYEFLFLGKDDVSISDRSTLEKLFTTHHPAFLINCAAYTAVDKAEEEKQAALEINGTAVGNLAALCKQFGTNLIHISTDYVFDGNTAKPWIETDTAEPINIYGKSKLLGEELALQSNPNTLVIRTSWVYSSYGKNFVKTMIRLMQEKPSINVVNDQFGSPTYAADLAEVIVTIISSGKWVPGVYHFSNDGVTSWFNFAVKIKQLTGAGCEVKPITTYQYPTPAQRPKYSVMDKRKIREVYGIELKPWDERLEACLAKLNR